MARRVVVCVLLLAAAFAASAHELLATLREQVLTLPGEGGAELETTLYRPPGDGPFRLVVVNHGKASGDPRRQPRARYLWLARELVRRGYAVVVPMRRGFAHSGGHYEPHACDAEANGRAQAADVETVLEAMAQRPDIDATRVVVIGQSAGGLATLALGAAADARVAGLVNFAGGLREDGCDAWPLGLGRAFAAYGRGARAPSLWFYGEDDALFAPPLAHELHQRYTAAGGDATFVGYAGFGSDAHDIVDRAAGRAVWLPALARFFARLGLPFEPQREIALAEHETPAPPSTAFAPLGQIGALPYISGAGVAAYADFLAAERPRAFALGADGSWAWYAGAADAMRRALDACRDHAGRACRLYAVDDTVVWTPE